MHTVSVNELRPGMITADHVVSRYGQLIVEKNRILSYQMIAHIRYYGITKVAITDGELPSEAIEHFETERNAVLSYNEKIKKSPQFLYFKKEYDQKVDFLQDSLNDLIVRNIPCDMDHLLEQTLCLFQKNSTTISMFDMLHNMRRINDSTYAHSLNVAIIGRMIGMWTDLDKKDLDVLTLGGLLHDTGKCMIANEIINKPGALTDAEYAEIKKHPRYGYEIVKDLNIDPRVKKIVLNHHERCDGTGYPIGLYGDDIDDFSDIISIADVYDAMTADRCYRSGMCPFEVIATFEKEGLEKYKPQYILTFLEHIANTYINNDVLLSNGQTGKIVLINKQHLTRPVIQMSDNKFVNLETQPELYVQAII